MNTAYVKYADQAAYELERTTGLRVQWFPASDSQEASLDIYTDPGPGCVQLVAVAVRKASDQSITALMQAENPEKTILVAGVIPKALQDSLRERRLNYLDAAGNCYIRTKGLYILVEGRRPISIASPKVGLFTKSSLRILFTLLTQPEAVNLPIRELSRRTGVSVGAVQQTIERYKQLAYVIPLDAKRWTLFDPDYLRQQWITRYEHELKPSLLGGRFRLPKGMQAADWRTIELQSGSFWGGEAAADALTNLLRPATLTVYTGEQQAQLIRNYRLLPDPQGVVEVVNVFWQPTNSPSTDVPIVPPLLICADLMAIGDPRAHEVAHHIYDTYV